MDCFSEIAIPQMYRNSANVPQFRNYSAIELRYFAELRNICGIADNCGLRNCGYLGLKIRNVPQYRKSQLFRNCLFAAPSLGTHHDDQKHKTQKHKTQNDQYSHDI